MTPFDAPTPESPRPRGRSRIHTSLAILPSLFTIGNMFCGYYSIASTLEGRYDVAAVFIGLGAVLDMLDGRIARLTNTNSEFGVELDSLADVLTFGIAPAVLALNWGLRSLPGLPAEIAQDVYKFGWLATFLFLTAGALRLARFNVLARKPGDAGAAKRHFIGLPIPAAALVIAAIVHFEKSPLVQVTPALLWALLIVTLGFLMISTVRYPSFKNIDLRKPLPRSAIAGTAMLIGLIIFFSEIVLLVIACGYAGAGPAMRLYPLIRRLRSPRRDDPASAPRGDAT